MIRHFVQAAASAAVGTAVGLLAGLDGRIALFLPPILIACAAGAGAGRRSPPSQRTMAAMIGGSAAWLGIWVSQQNLYAWPNGLERTFTGSGYCGDFSCAGQVFVTTPLLVCLAYVAGALLGARHLIASRLFVTLGCVAYLAAFTASWLWLSGRTQNSLYERHIYPYSPGKPPSPDLWPFRAAEDDYRRQPPEIRRMRAAVFHDSILNDLAKDNYFDAGPYRETFIRGSVDGMMNVTTDATGTLRQYRDIFGYSLSVGSMPRRDIPRLTRDASVIAMGPAALLFVAMWFVMRRRR